MHSPSKLCALAAQARSKRERRKEARPGELLDAALALFVEKGFAATRAEEVAQRAGVSKGTLFLYFSSKEELFKAVVRENISNLFGAWEQRLAAHDGSSEALLRWCMHDWWAKIGSTKAGGICKLMVSEATNFPELAHFYQAEVVQPGEQLVRRVLERGVASGEFVPTDPVYGVYSMIAPLLFLTLWRHSFAACGAAPVEIVPAQYIDSHLDMVLKGIRRHDAPAQPQRGCE